MHTEHAAIVRARDSGDDAMLRLVAELYYVREHSQADIAALTGYSVSTVSRLLARARAAGVVEIHVKPRTADLQRRAREVARALAIASVHITATHTASPSLASRLCGVAAAPWVSSLIPHQGVLGLVSGHTVAALIDSISGVTPRPGLTVVSLVAGWDPASPDLDANEAVRRAAEKLQCTYRLLATPAVLDSPELKRALLRESGIRITTDYWRRVDLALVGIGGPPGASPGYRTVMDRLTAAERQRLAAKGVVGDLSGHLFTLSGAFVGDEIRERTIAAPVGPLRRRTEVIAIAAGAHKVASIIGAARTGLVGTLVTDELTAAAILRQV